MPIKQYEELTRVVLKAMACGLPVICTTSPGGEDIVREGFDFFIIPIRNKKRGLQGFTCDDYGNKMIKSHSLTYNEIIEK